MNTPIKDISIQRTQPAKFYEGAVQSASLLARTLHMIGFGFDGTACFRKGTRNGPDALRYVSDDIETWSPYLERDLEDVQFVDLGNLVTGPVVYADEDDPQGQKAVADVWQKASDDFLTLFGDVDLKAHGLKIMTFGGEHSISWAPIKTHLDAYPDLCLVHLDAHADLRDGYLGYHYSHASIIRRSLEHFGPGHDLIQYGIRSGTREEYQWMRDNQTLVGNRDAFLDKLQALPDDRPIYLTFDLDYFDPAYFPGTGTPEPGGEDFHSFVSLCKILQNKNFVGCDVVELSPEIDPTGNSDVFAAKVVRELILCLQK